MYSRCSTDRLTDRGGRGQLVTGNKGKNKMLMFVTMGRWEWGQEGVQVVVT